MKIATESKTGFDSSVSTEARFALRKWLEELVQEINNNDVEKYGTRLYSNLVVEGFSQQPMNKEQYLEFLERPHLIRFPELLAKFQRSRFVLQGSYEQFVDGILSYEGTVEVLVLSNKETFQLATLKFFPRLRPAQANDEN